ncbi:MAG: HAD family phosphatase [Myxococcota bacterium]|nr:HAD family phosphatase [Myxococcales bacterium]
MPPRYLLFDHDGVLVDTERWYFEATRTALAGLGVALSEATYLEWMADGRPCWGLALERGASEAEVAAAREARNDLYRDLLAREAVEIEGVGEVLAELAARHRMGIVTTSRRTDFELVQRGRGLVDHFEFVITVEDVARAKPHPEPYLAGLARFGARPEEALVVEDSSRGLAAAHAAGIACLVVRNAFTAPQDFGLAWRVVDSIRDVPEAVRARP